MFLLLLLLSRLLGGQGEEGLALADEQGQGGGGGQGVGDGLGDVDAHDVAHRHGQDDGQGDQQDDLAQQGQEQAGPGLTQGHEGRLAGHLGPEGPDAPEEYGHHPGHQLDQLLVVVEQHGQGAWDEQHDEEGAHRGRQGHPQQQPEGPADPGVVARPVVEAHERLHPLGDPLDGHGDHLHDALDDGEGAHVQVAPVPLQAGVQHHGDQALGGLHDERGHPQAGDPRDHGPPQAHILRPDAQTGAAAAQEQHHPGGAHRLGQDGGQSRPPDPHVKDEDEHRVQHDVQDRPDEHRAHGGHGPPLGADEGVQAQGQLDKDGAQQVDGDIVGGIADGGLRGAEGHEHRPLDELEHHRQHRRGAQEQGHRVAQDALSPLPVSRPQADGGQRGAPLAGKGGEGGDQGDDGKGHPQAGEGGAPDDRDVADIDAVHDVVQQVDELGRHRGHRQLPHQLPDGGGGQGALPAAGGSCQGDSLPYVCCGVGSLSVRTGRRRIRPAAAPCCAPAPTGWTTGRQTAAADCPCSPPPAWRRWGAAGPPPSAGGHPRPPSRSTAGTRRAGPPYRAPRCTRCAGGTPARRTAACPPRPR